jgi:hypothetical protein
VNKLQILRQVTKPMTEAKVAEVVRARYGVVRENVSRDDTAVVLRAQVLDRRKAERQAVASTPRPRRIFGY